MIAAIHVNDPDRMVGLLAFTALFIFVLIRMIRSFLSAPIKPDPWGEEVAAELDSSESLPLCHRCLQPHSLQVDFCPKCGAPVGAYTNFLPFPYLFSIGHTLRLGTAGDFKHSPLTALGFLVFSFAQYFIFAPVYWFVFFRNWSPGARINGEPHDARDSSSHSCSE